METDFTFETGFSLILIIVVVGATGNALTLASVIYAKIKKKHNFDDSAWLSSTVFVLNLAFADITYCVFFMSMGVYGYRIYLKHDVGDTSSGCKFFILGIQNLATIDGWSIALIAFTRAFPKIR